MEYINKGKNKIRLNRFEDFKQEDIDWILNILNKRVDASVNHILKVRESKLKNKDKTFEELKSGELLTPA